MKCKKNCQVDWVYFLLALFGDWGDFFFQSSCISDHHGLSKMIECDLAKMSTSFLSTLCIQLRPIDLWMSSLTKWFLPQFSWTKNKSFFFQVFSLISWAYSRGLALAVNAVSREGVQYLSLLCSLFWKGPCTTQRQACIFPSISFAIGILEKTFLLSMTCLASLISNGPWPSSF